MKTIIVALVLATSLANGQNSCAGLLQPTSPTVVMSCLQPKAKCVCDGLGFHCQYLWVCPDKPRPPLPMAQTDPPLPMAQTDPSIIMQLQSPRPMTPFDLLNGALRIQQMRQNLEASRAASAAPAATPTAAPASIATPLPVNQRSAAESEEYYRLQAQYLYARALYPDFDAKLEAGKNFPVTPIMAYVMKRHEVGMPRLMYWLATHEAEDRRIFDATIVPQGATEEQIDLAKAKAWSEFRQIEQQLQSAPAAKPAATASMPTSDPSSSAFLNLVRQDANQGNVNAQFALGAMYELGRGVPQDYPEAVRWFRKAAEQGDANSQSKLGVMYFLGQNVLQDYAEAIRWSRKAAEQGNADSQSVLGLMYAQGLGAPKNSSESVLWFRRAAEQGKADSQASLGISYFLGLGVPKDLVQAYMWMNLAVSRASGIYQEEAAKTRDMVAKEMTAQQIAAAQRLAREWKPKPAAVSSEVR